MDNRRNYRRIPTDNVATLRVTSFPNPPPPRRLKLDCMTTDVSGSGTRITLMARPRTAKEPGTDDFASRLRDGTRAVIAITFSKPRKSFKLEGTIRWIKREGGSPALVFGVEFLDEVLVE